jgi:CheY-like chemotaxis protein
LIVDDEDVVRMVGSDILAEGGYRVLEAANAAEALECLEGETEVVVLFTDVNMPGTPDGLGLARLVKSRWPEVKTWWLRAMSAPARTIFRRRSCFSASPTAPTISSRWFTS